jgi:transposase-like protein
MTDGETACLTIVKLWQKTWEDFIPFLARNVEFRKVICSMNAIDNVNACYRKAVKARRDFPTEQSTLKCL